MPYQHNEALPDKVRDHLPTHAQSIYREAFNHAFETYKQADKHREHISQEETAHRVAWAAVEKKYTKSKEGKWIEKDE